MKRVFSLIMVCLLCLPISTVFTPKTITPNPPSTPAVCNDVVALNVASTHDAPDSGGVMQMKQTVEESKADERVPSSISGAQASTGAVRPMSSSGSVTVIGCFVRTEGGASLPVRCALVTLTEGGNMEPIEVARTYADVAGCFSLAVSEEYANRNLQVWCIAESRYARVIRKDSPDPMYNKVYHVALPPHTDYLPGGSTWDVGTLNIGWDYFQEPLTADGLAAFRILDNVLTERTWVYDKTGWERKDLINIYFPNNDVSASQFRWTWWFGWETWIDLRSDASRPQDVFHEYAHAIMYELYDGMPSGDGPDPHFISSHSSPGYAMREGWAHFMADVMNCYWLGHPDPQTEINSFYTVHFSILESLKPYNHPPEYMDGNIVEGSVASILWDMFAPKSTEQPGDLHMEIPFEDIWGFFRDDKPESILGFYCYWMSYWMLHEPRRYMDWVGPLCTVYWNSGIDLDAYSPTGSVTIQPLTTIEGVKFVDTNDVWLSFDFHDWGSGFGSLFLRNSPDEGWKEYLNHENTYWTLLPGDGKRTVYVQFRDKAGHFSAVYSDQIIVDTVRPQCSITIDTDIPPYVKTRQIILRLEYSDDTSGVYKAQYRNEGESWDNMPWEDPCEIKGWTLPGPAGSKRVYYRVMDKSGHVSNECFAEVFFTDAEPTEIFFNFNPNPAPVDREIKLKGMLVGRRSGARIAGASILINFSKDDVTWSYFWSEPTDGCGIFRTTLPELESGWYYFKAKYISDVYHFDCESTAYVNVTLGMGSSSSEYTGALLLFNFNPNPADGRSELKGILVDTSEYLPITGVDIEIWQSGDDGQTWTYGCPFAESNLLRTDDYGIFSTTFSWKGQLPVGTPIPLVSVCYIETTAVSYLGMGREAPVIIAVPIMDRLFWRINPIESTSNPLRDVMWRGFCITLPVGQLTIIDPSSIRLNGTIAADAMFLSLGDYNLDGSADATVRFNRTALSQFLLSRNVTIGNVTLTLTGELYDGTSFEQDVLVRVRLFGDVNGDGKVDVKDLYALARAFGSELGSPKWDGNADQNEDGKIDVKDYFIACKNYGKP